MIRIALFLTACALPQAAYAECKYDQLVAAGVMSKEVASKYCTAEALKIQAEVRFKETTDKCHTQFNRGAASSELSKCLTEAQAKLNEGIEAFQKRLREAEGQPQASTSPKKNGSFEKRDGNTLERGRYVNGLLDGKYEDITYFDQEASPKYRGKEDEKRVYIYVKGKRNGKFERYSEGKLVEKGQYKDDAEAGTWEYLRDGKWEKRVYCPNGMVTDTAEGSGDCSQDSVGG